MKNILLSDHLDFQLPEQLQKAQPTEARGLERDAVRLMVSERKTNRLTHTQFSDIGRFLRQGDVLVVNTSATLPAALDIRLPDGMPGRLHVSTRQNESEAIVEIRAVRNNATRRFTGVQPGLSFRLPGGGVAAIIAPFYRTVHGADHLHLWVARFHLPEPLTEYLQKHGNPIRYDRLFPGYPLEYYQTVFAQEPGSAEMPSAGRAFTPALVARLIVKGIQFAPVLLHTGVSGIENGEEPYPEFYRVPATTASLINAAKREKRRIIAVGTTAVRAVETTATPNGTVQAGEGWTSLYITPERGMRTVTGLLSGFHEPKASHLLMLEALTGREHLETCYRGALDGQYQWHEFGDMHLML